MSLSKLKDAAEFFSETEYLPWSVTGRAGELNGKLREAKKLTSEYPNLIYKVKGSPGNYNFIKIH